MSDTTRPPEPASPEQRVAAALKAMSGGDGDRWYYHGDERGGPHTNEEFAAAILGRQHLREDLAVGAVVRESGLLDAVLAWLMFNRVWDGEWETTRDLIDAASRLEDAIR